jgi:hypothetical protein
MGRAEKYRLVAQSLREQASEEAVLTIRDQMLELAEHFEKLATDAESEVGRNPPGT